MVRGLGRPLGLTLSGGGRQMPEFRGRRVEWVPCWPDLLISIPSGPRLPVSGVRGTEWALFAIVGRHRIMDVKCGVAHRRAFPLLDVGGVGLVHGIVHIDLRAGCV